MRQRLGQQEQLVCKSSCELLMMARVRFTGFRRVSIALMTVSGGEVRMTGSGSRILGFEMPFRFLMVVGCFLVVVRGIVMMERSGMLTGHEYLHHGAARRHS